jgi:catechol 2,3-dioxygenase-like lactoylglutathione lyase family enzyme
MTIEPLGIDNVVFGVADLDAAIEFYRRCGLGLKFRLDQPGIALLTIGTEEPGLMLRVETRPSPARLWVEVHDAGAAAAALATDGIPVTRLETATGITVEAADPSGNIIGFADYSKRPELARKR